MSCRIVPSPTRSHHSGRVNPQMSKGRSEPLFPAIAAIKNSQNQLPAIGLVRKDICKKQPERPRDLIPNAQGSRVGLPLLVGKATEKSPDDKSSPETHLRNSRALASAFDALIIKTQKVVGNPK